ncbi:MAG: ABC transporter permease subunit, partial [Chloroflexi bacterium]|nr:ABC transporter permease subunit [Chloroflexota bacterium]
MKPPFVAAVRAIVSKDLRAEWRSRELVSAMALFSLLTVLVFSFALELDKSAREAVISGVLWVSLIFASLLGFNRSLSLEHDQGSLDALLLAPVSRSALFVGKLLGNFTFTMLVALMLLPLMTALYG